MKSMAEGILALLHQAHDIFLDVACLNKEEEKGLQELRVQTNISRINMMMIVILILEGVNVYILTTTSSHARFRTQYLCADFAMLIACIIQITYFHIRKCKKLDSYKSSKRYVTLWVIQLTAITWYFHVLEFMENRHYENMFLLLLVLNIILILKNREILICMAAILICEYGFLVYIGGKANNYLSIAVLLICAWIVGRLFFIYYMNSNLFQWKLKKVNEELEKQINRYKILQKLTKEDIFEYNHKEDKMIITYASGKPSKIYYNYIQKVQKHYIGFFEEKDELAILNAYKELLKGNEMKMLTFYTKEASKTKRKYEVMYTTIFNDLKQPIITIGKLYKSEE